MLTDKTIVVTGGTGSLGQVLVRRLLRGELGRPAKVIVYSRDEAKQHAMRLAYQQRTTATDEVIYRGLERTLQFHVGDVRDAQSLRFALRDADVVFHAAALKQVPTCEYFPYEAVQTNIDGAQNIVRAVGDSHKVQTVVGISTDKACKPVNVMGMTKAIQERILIRANHDLPRTRFVCVRYGNVLASRGSVIPLFHSQIRQGGPLTITTPEMTRFLLSLQRAVDAVFAALTNALPGEIYVPRAPAARMQDLASVLIGPRPIQIVELGVRPGEKIHEILISEEEAPRSRAQGDYLVIQPVLPELRHAGEFTPLAAEYCSASDVLSTASLFELLKQNQLLVEDPPSASEGLA